MFCSNCGKQNLDNAKFCESCGKPIVNTSAPQYTPPPPPQYTQPQPQYAPPPQPIYQPPQQSPFAPNAAQPVLAEVGISPKSRTATALLCFFFSILGIYRFYAGKAGTGVLMLLLTIVGSILLVTPIMIAGAIILWVLGLWAFIDFIMILVGKFKDKNGLYIKR